MKSEQRILVMRHGSEWVVEVRAKDMIEMVRKIEVPENIRTYRELHDFLVIEVGKYNLVLRNETWSHHVLVVGEPVLITEIDESESRAHHAQ